MMRQMRRQTRQMMHQTRNQIGKAVAARQQAFGGDIEKLQGQFEEARNAARTRLNEAANQW